MTESEHQDVYFSYILPNDISFGQIYHINAFTFNQKVYKFKCNEAYMSGTPKKVTVYACKEDEKNVKPWLLQVVGCDTNKSAEAYLNYFFKPDENISKIHEFTNLKVTDGQSFQLKQDSQAKSLSENTFSFYISEASHSSYYEFKESDKDSEIEPDKLGLYLMISQDEKHKNNDQEHFVSSISSGSGKHSFEITLKGLTAAKQEVTVTYNVEDASGFKVNLTQKGSPTTKDLSSHGLTCENANIRIDGPVYSDVSNGRVQGSKHSNPQQTSTGGLQEAQQPADGSPGSQPSGSSDASRSSITSSLKNQSPPSSSSPGRPGSVGGGGIGGPAPGGTGEHMDSNVQPPQEHGKVSADEYPDPSSNIPAIVCGALFGSGGLIGTGYFIYQRIG
ncbi:hypothetical protein BdWA1_001169 [Babesia duncani]|uniref:Uncharacterized protein n=1 Tax=Babesia duncani TaxID=323732 RepID=A0AAD9UQP9_9APIC|nr:hypothetical protein BdWA1_001169 [Babesia duncani]